MLAVLNDILVEVDGYDDRYGNKHLVVVRCPDPDDYMIVDLGGCDDFGTQKATIRGDTGFREHYRFVEAA
jgi:hypothetical protein